MAALEGGDAFLNGKFDQFHTVFEAKLLHHAVFVKGYRPGRNIEDLGRLPHRPPFRQKLKDLALPG